MNRQWKALRWARWLRARWHYLLGMGHRHWGIVRGERAEYEAAIMAFDRALTFDPTMAHVYLDRGILCWRELDHPRRAIQDLNQALQLDPALHEARFNRGVAYQTLGEFAQACQDFAVYLDVGEHTHWREYAEKMLAELCEERPEAENAS